MVYAWFLTSPTAFDRVVLLLLSLRLEGEENMSVRNIYTRKKTMDSIHSLLDHSYILLVRFWEACL
jgi:hypothetical protein